MLKISSLIAAQKRLQAPKLTSRFLHMPFHYLACSCGHQRLKKLSLSYDYNSRNYNIF